MIRLNVIVACRREGLRYSSFTRSMQGATQSSTISLTVTSVATTTSPEGDAPIQ